MHFNEAIQVPYKSNSTPLEKSHPRSSLGTHTNAPDTREQCQLMPAECSRNNNNIPEGKCH